MSQKSERLAEAVSLATTLRIERLHVQARLDTLSGEIAEAERNLTELTGHPAPTERPARRRTKTISLRAVTVDCDVALRSLAKNPTGTYVSVVQHALNVSRGPHMAGVTAKYVLSSLKDDGLATCEGTLWRLTNAGLLKAKSLRD